MSVEVRAASEQDVARCVHLWTRVVTARDGAGASDDVADRVWAAFALPIVRFAVIGPAPDGFALTVTRDRAVAVLSRLCVDPSASGRGAGTALVADAVKHARDAGLERMELDVRVTNKPAIAVYARAGFVPISAPWDYDGGELMETHHLML